jgi:UDPglucose 6-dehydrogenase
MGSDHRIGRAFLNAGIGYGGSCFPKDVSAFIHICREVGAPFPLLEEVQRINSEALNRFLAKIRNKLWVLKDKKIAVWGLAFKENTDDVRNSVSIELIKMMLEEGARIVAYDPQGTENAIQVMPASSHLKYASSPLKATGGADALVIATEWKVFTEIEMDQVKRAMHTPLLFDGRNLLNPGLMRDLGFDYVGVGR